jgi:hypothetical protein
MQMFPRTFNLPRLKSQIGIFSLSYFVSFA